MTEAADDAGEIGDGLYHAKNVYVCRNKVAKPRVFIPVFPEPTVNMTAPVRLSVLERKWM